MKFRALDIPDSLREELVAKGYDDMYDHQAEAIPKALEGRNLVVAVPTASGKSIIGIVPALNMVLLHPGRRVLYIVPLKALATEKRDDFQEFGEKLGIRVFMASEDPDRDDRIDDADIVVATSEKADSMLRHGNKWIEGLGMVIVDEVHNIHDPGRGPTLEVTMTKFLCMREPPQMIALSATITNSEDLAKWLDADLVKSDWRPTELREGVYYDDEIEFNKGGKVQVPPEYNRRGEVSKTADPVWRMIKQTVSSKDGGQCIVFVNSRKSTEALAAKYSKDMKEITGAKINDSERILVEGGSESTSTGVKLAQCIDSGIAFHHAGLDYKQRRCVEEGFRFGNIKCIIATPTLAAGINLPARRVIVRDTMRFESNMGNVALPVMEIKQMCGRAGRPRYDPWGESVLVAKSEEDRGHLFDDYIFAKSEKLTSKLTNENVLKTHILGLIASGDAHSENELLRFMGRTFYGSTSSSQTAEIDGEDVQIPYGMDYAISKVVGFLEEQSLVRPVGMFRILKDLGEPDEKHPNHALIHLVLSMANGCGAAEYDGETLRVNMTDRNNPHPEPAKEMKSELESVLWFMVNNRMLGEPGRKYVRSQDIHDICGDGYGMKLFEDILNLLEAHRYIRKSSGSITATDKEEPVRLTKVLHYVIKSLSDYLEKKGFTEKITPQDMVVADVNQILDRLDEEDTSRNTRPKKDTGEDTRSWHFVKPLAVDAEEHPERTFIDRLLAFLSRNDALEYDGDTLELKSDDYDDPGTEPENVLAFFSDLGCIHKVYTWSGEEDSSNIRMQLAYRVLDQLQEHRFVSVVDDTVLVTNRDRRPVDLTELYSSLLCKVIPYLENEKLAERVTSLKDGGGSWEFRITPIGKRISDLYIDPWSSVILRKAINQIDKDTDDFMILHAICCTPDILGMYPKKGDAEELEKKDREYDGRCLCTMQDECGPDADMEMENDTHLANLKTAILLQKWINEVPEDALTDTMGIGPGDIHSRVDDADWLIYAMREIATNLGNEKALERIKPLLTRIRYGIKEELIPLVAFKGVARTRARTLFNAGYENADDILNADEETLANLHKIGKALARNMKEQAKTIAWKPSVKVQERETIDQDVDHMLEKMAAEEGAKAVSGQSPVQEREVIDQELEYMLEKMAAEEEAKNRPAPEPEPPAEKKTAKKTKAVAKKPKEEKPADVDPAPAKPKQQRTLFDF